MTIAEKLIQQGMQQGILAGKIKTAKNLLQMGISVEQVVKATEIPEEEILKIEKELHKKN
ncbi:hypothetical protein [Desulfuribacillus alkaliarsenatis]|uniref:Transposase n=1 Tax=Desulfuribacillus alkaliarsenatis TaxID=766136 RepID=A0A1E5G0Y0_9FIRM|nr:hypothetical protein [Desulfuribacillus alkaliarsenatis]OEF96568.1 hypothetical protein BHF68_07945 [Desulfuribacillus alkaliarsenatis]